MSAPLARVATETPAGWRLNFLPHPLRQLIKPACGWSIVAALGALLPAWVVMLVSMAGSTPFGTSVRLFGLTWAGVTVAGALCGTASVREVWAAIRWVEFPIGHGPAHIICAGGLRGHRSRTIATTDLQRVVLEERLKLGQLVGRKVILHARDDRQVTCAANSFALKTVSTDDLAEWLRERLRPLGVPLQHVQHEAEFTCPDEWYTQGTVAALWQVPVDEVDPTARKRGIPTYTYTPRAFAMHSPQRTVVIYHPGRVHQVANELRAEQTSAGA
jgi:hypothetical protein